MLRGTLRRIALTYTSASPLHRFLIIAGTAIVLTGFSLFLKYHTQIITAFLVWAQHWRQVRGGWIFLWLAIVATAFPPLPGYAFSLTLSGFLYGFPHGWFLCASASVIGAALSFLVCRTILLPSVRRLLSSDERFKLYLRVLKHGNVKLLCMLKLCPVPYSLSNAAFAATPTVTFSNFIVASALVTPKLLTHVVIGSQMAASAETGAQDPWSTTIRYASILFAILVGTGTAVYVFRKTKALADSSDAEDIERSL